jgi:trimethylamine:corrinoid methyltransferase-like protein
MRESQRPTLRMIADDAVERVVGEALRVLAEVGIVVESPSVRELLSDGGGNVSDDGRVRIPETLCLRCLETAPDRFELQNLRGTSSIVVGGDDVCFDPGSAALTLHEPDSRRHRFRSHRRRPSPLRMSEHGAGSIRRARRHCRQVSVAALARLCIQTYRHRHLHTRRVRCHVGVSRLGSWLPR